MKYAQNLKVYKICIFMWDILKKVVLKLLNIIMGLVISLEIVWKLFGKCIRDFWKISWKFIGNWCNISLNERSWYNWVGPKRTDKCQLPPPG